MARLQVPWHPRFAAHVPPYNPDVASSRVRDLSPLVFRVDNDNIPALHLVYPVVANTEVIPAQFDDCSEDEAEDTQDIIRSPTPSDVVR